MSAKPEIRVLVVDDDEEIFELIAALLAQSTRAEYSIDYLVDVMQVKDRVERGTADVVLVDQNLGQSLTGLDLVAQCSEFLVPMVLVTSEDRDQLDYEALNAGAAGFVLKRDLSTSVLDRTIRYALARLNQIRSLVSETASQRKMALTDPLTGMPNRREFDLRLNLAIENAQRDGSEFGILYIDLNGFKQVNDVHGHDAGDSILRVIASRLLDEFRTDDSICRVGGDEFVAIILNNRRESGIKELMDSLTERLTVRISEIITIGEFRLLVSASFGVAIYPRDGSDAGSLLRNADRAMFNNKIESRQREIL